MNQKISFPTEWINGKNENRTWDIVAQGQLSTNTTIWTDNKSTFSHPDNFLAANLVCHADSSTE